MSLMDPLFAFQEEIVRDILFRPKTYLAADMGCGKSRMALEVAKQRGVTSLLIFCPAVGRLVWKREIQKWWPDSPPVTVIRSPRDMAAALGKTGILIVGYPTISGSQNGFNAVAGLQTHKFQMTIIDEAHALKNPGAIRTKSILKTLKPVLGDVLPMSGTPAPNHAGELHAILHALFPETITLNGHAMKQYEFEDRYCHVVNKFFGKSRPVRTIEGSKNLQDLKHRLEPIMIRKRKSEVLMDLPDMRFDTWPIDAPDAPAWWGRDAETEEDLMKDFFLHVATMRRALGMSKVWGAVEVVSEILDETREKVIVFAHHQSVIDRLMELLAGFAPVKIDGRTSPAERQKSIDTFLDDPRCRVFIGNIQAAGTSITLVGPNCAVSNVVFVESSFSPGDNVQAASRIHRLGQHAAVMVWFLTAAGTYDERIMEIVARKAKDFHVLFDQKT